MGNQLQRRDAAVVLAAHLPAMTWSDEERLLDIGCGSGDVTSSLLVPTIPVAPASVVGVDLSKEMVDYANDAYSTEWMSFQQMASSCKWAPYMLDVEDFVPVYQDTTDPATQFKSVLGKAGFATRKCEAAEFSFTFQNQNQLLSALRAVNPF